MSASMASGRLSAMALLAEAGGGIVGGLVLAVVGYFVTFLLFAGAGLGLGLLAAQLFGSIIGFGLGAGLGVALVGRLMGQPGRAWAAALAGCGSAVAVILVMRLLNVGGLGGLLVVGLPLTLAAALLAYHLGRRR